MSAATPTLLVIVASTRPGRVGIAVGEWFRAHAEAHGGFDVRVVDLAELALPFFDEPRHPRTGRYEHEHTRRWSAIVDAADAVAVVTPEYNHSYNAVLKNALDFLHHEWADKPVGLVSYGGVAAGTRAVQALKPVFAALRMPVAVEAVNIPFVANFVHDGTLEPTPVLEQSATAVLDELVRLEGMLRPARAARAELAATRA